MGLAAGLALLARASLASLEPCATMRARLRPAAMAVGLGLAMLAVFLAGEGGGGAEAAGRAGLVGLLLAAAWVDRQTAWVPDSLLVPLMLAAGAHSAVLGPLAGAAAGAGLYLACLGLWAVQGALGRRVLTPPDAAALALPVVLFGAGAVVPALYAACAGLLLAARAWPALRRALSPEAPLAAALAESGQDARKATEAVAFLPVMLPLLALAVGVGWAP